MSSKKDTQNPTQRTNPAKPKPKGFRTRNEPR